MNLYSSEILLFWFKHKWYINKTLLTNLAFIFYRNHIPQSGTVRTTELVFGMFNLKDRNTCLLSTKCLPFQYLSMPRAWRVLTMSLALMAVSWLTSTRLTLEIYIIKANLIKGKKPTYLQDLKWCKYHESWTFREPKYIL